ncbi:MAG TPA: hypothetical protein VFV50_11455 [Bdellovibrionales bacterium]|nr:hypothetical protein [Bdellovibrionales bacterium]
MKKTPYNLTAIFAVALGFALSFSSARAAEDDEIGYDTLVKELSAESPGSGDMFANVEIHFGAALANSMATIVPKGGSTLYSAQRGVQASLGIDLFSRHWLAEGSFINYIDRKIDEYDVRLKEFDLKVIYRTRLDGSIGMRLGGGLAARYLTLETGGASETFTTPFTVISGGLETYLVKNFSLGAEVAARTTMTYETPDHSALDLTLRFDGHF